MFIRVLHLLQDFCSVWYVILYHFTPYHFISYISHHTIPIFHLVLAHSFMRIFREFPKAVDLAFAFAKCFGVAKEWNVGLEICDSKCPHFFLCRSSVLEQQSLWSLYIFAEKNRDLAKCL